ncbi:MAG TPA: sensor histidine kinase KdpD [Clostridiales bacterium]|nr:sensor histidine kinase KdpD [Clostridiales bacterium]
MEDTRIDPDALLKRIKYESRAEKRGHLKIFFGYAAGVGKTFAMLRAAHSARLRNVDVVIGYVEPHQRPQTTALLKGLEQIPTLSVVHKGIKINEFNLDAAIQRKPKVILVDELAHTNAQECRHVKRYQDVEELLKAGIDVYTTINVQHIESLNDMVAAITGVTVRERIPDRVFDNADQVELVDIEPQELIDRLNAGKIYNEQQAQKALGNFFDEKNLTALREIALRRCADRVSKMTKNVKLAGNMDYYTDEHILVGLSSSPTNPKIIRTAARMADAFKGRFTALFVETPDFEAMSDEDKKRLRSNIHLAEQLGATIETVYGDDVSLEISEFSRLSSVSKLVIGRNNAKRKYIWSKQTLTEKLTANAPNLDIYIIPDKEAEKYKEKKVSKGKIKFALSDIIASVLVLITATIVGFIFYNIGFSEVNIITIYILGVLITAIFTSHKAYSLISSIVSVLTFNFFFIEPRFTFSAYDSGYPATFLIMFISAFITSTLAVKIKQHAHQSAETAYRTNILLETNQLLQKNDVKSNIVSATAGQLTKLLRKDIIFYLSENGELLEPSVFTATNNDDVDAYVSSNEKAVAAWVFKNNKHAGATTNTLGSAKCLYLAVRVNDTVYGVVGIAMENTQLDAFEHSIVLSVLGECAVALEHEKILKEREQTAVLAKNEQLRANLLRSISHDLRTPLTSISGNAGILLESGATINTHKKRQLYMDIYEDSLWLINLVENLLSVTRIEDGTMNLNLSAELIDEVVDEALRHINRKAVDHKITVKQSEDFILAKMDARLIVQVVINIVDNAIKYTPVGSEIEIVIKKENNMVVVSVADNGNGIPDDVKPKIFDMFFTANMKVADSRRSMGLGLALCKSIIMAHGGEISVKDNKPSGAVFTFTLPAEEVTLHE